MNSAMWRLTSRYLETAYSQKGVAGIREILEAERDLPISRVWDMAEELAERREGREESSDPMIASLIRLAKFLRHSNR